MTIFVDVIKKLIIKALQDAFEKSIVADKGILSGQYRNVKLSKEQRKINENLQDKIKEFNDAETDEQSLKEINELLSLAIDEVSLIRANYTSVSQNGKFLAKLDFIKSTMEKFHRKLEQLNKENRFNFLDLDFDNGPFSILCQRSLIYIGEHYMFPANENYQLISGICNFWSNSAENERISKAKEECLISNLMICKESIDNRIKNSEYERLIKQDTIDAITKIFVGNSKICNVHGLIEKIPFSYGIIKANLHTPVVKPSRGRLKELMTEAMEEIVSDSPKKPPTQSWNEIVDEMVEFSEDLPQLNKSN